MMDSILYYVPSFIFGLQSPCLKKDLFVSDKTCMRRLKYDKIHRRNNLTPILNEAKAFFFLFFEF